MWTYQQTTGKLHNAAGVLVATGYAGHGVGRNNPAMQYTHDSGPAPQGDWTFGPPENRPHRQGPFVLPLHPKHGTDLKGRSGFLIHGDSRNHDASLGCLIFGPEARHLLWSSNDHELRIVA